MKLASSTLLQISCAYDMKTGGMVHVVLHMIIMRNNQVVVCIHSTILPLVHHLVLLTCAASWWDPK